MKTLHRNKRKLYLCKAYEENGRRKFEAPIELYENWQITNTDAEFMNLGLELFNFGRIRTSKEHANYYHVGDRVYLFTTPPVIPTQETTSGETSTQTETTGDNNQTVQEEPTPTYDEFATTADYQVYKDPIITLNECTVWLQKLSGRNGDKIY